MSRSSELGPMQAGRRELCRIWLLDTRAQCVGQRRLAREQRRALARRCVAAHLGVAPAQVTIGHLASGQPVLQAPGLERPFAFSVSDSGGWLAVATADAARVGVDIETTAGREVHPAALHWLAPAEEAAVRMAPDAQRRTVFLGIWTQKEACLKALGVGLAGSLGTFNVQTRVNAPAGLDPSLPHPANVLTLHRVAFDGLIGAVACEGCDEVQVIRSDRDAPAWNPIGTGIGGLPYVEGARELAHGSGCHENGIRSDALQAPATPVCHGFSGLVTRRITLR